MTSSKSISLNNFRSPYDKELQDSVTRFYYSLTDEQEHFTLSLEDILATPEMFVLFDEEKKIVIGVGGVRPMSFVRVYFMVVHKDYQGIGQGKRLMNDIMQTLGQKDLVLLNVNRSNVKARRLYKTFGFETIYRHKIMATMLFKNTTGRFIKYPLIVALYLRNFFSS